MARHKTPQYLPRIKVWLLKGKSLTDKIARREWGCTRLAAYIYRLRIAGMKISTKIIYNRNGTQYARYRHEY